LHSHLCRETLLMHSTLLHTFFQLFFNVISQCLYLELLSNFGFLSSHWRPREFLPSILSPFPQLWFCLASSTTLKKGPVLGISRNPSATDLGVAQITNSPFFTFLAWQHASMSHRPYLWAHSSFVLKSLMGNISSTTQSNKLKKQQANWRIQQEESGTPLKSLSSQGPENPSVIKLSGSLQVNSQGASTAPQVYGSKPTTITTTLTSSAPGA
jgi:hypothetical protein